MTCPNLPYDEPLTPDNAKRALWGLELARVMANMTQCDESDAIADAIGNLLHLAHAIGIDPKETSAKAMRMFEEEIAIEPPGQIWPEVAEFGKKYDDQISD